VTSQGFHRGFTAAEKTELWDRWQRGESLKAIGRAFSKPSSAERASVLEDDRTVAGEMRVEGDPVARSAEQIGKHGLAALERLPPKVLAVEFDQVEGTEHNGMVILAVADEVEDREPVLIDDDGLAIEGA
jgi:hypothetical protein